MSDWKRIVCLANSRKLSGRCVAGREWSEKQGAGDWIRPVSERDNQAASENERQYELDNCYLTISLETIKSRTGCLIPNPTG